MRDLHNNVEVAVALTATAVSTNTTTVGAIIDLQDRDACEFVIHASGYGAGTYTPLIETGDEANLSDAAAVADTHLLGTEAGAALTANGVSKVGLVAHSGKRYARLSIVSTGTGGSPNGVTISASAVIGPLNRS